MKSIATAASLEKRIKRRVIGRDQEFFAVTLPGLEPLCLNELAALGIDEKRRRVSKGGVSFEARVHDAYAANLHLRTASRILMRIDHFQATGFRQLEKHIRDFPWELYLYTGQTFDLHVTSRLSRLIHTDAIAQRFKQGITDRFTDQAGLVPPGDTLPPAQTLFIRVIKDRFTVSIDASGEPLYKRGLKTAGAKAPLRETFAAAALSLAGFLPGDTLVDPMCGSGTFSIEAAMQTCGIPPGWYRKFAFSGWPSFRPGRWKHLRRQAVQKIRLKGEPSIFASDQAPDAVNRLKQIATKFELDRVLQATRSDFFTRSPAGLSGSPGTIALNPPYGIRLKTETPQDLFFAAIGCHLHQAFSDWNLAIILPGSNLSRHLPFKVDTLAFTHGGLNLTLATGRIQ